MLTSRETRLKSRLSEKVYINLPNEHPMCLAVLSVVPVFAKTRMTLFTPPALNANEAASYCGCCAVCVCVELTIFLVNFR